MRVTLERVRRIVIFEFGNLCSWVGKSVILVIDLPTKGENDLG